MNRDAILNRVRELRDEIEFLVREIQEYESRTFHSIQDQTVHARRMQGLDENQERVRRDQGWKIQRN